LQVYYGRENFADHPEQGSFPLVKVVSAAEATRILGPMRDTGRGVDIPAPQWAL